MQLNDLFSSQKRILETNHLKFFLISAIVVTFLTTALSIISVIYQEEIYSSETTLNSFVPTDIINLVIIVPLFLYLIWKSRNNDTIPVLTLLGVIWYNMYIYTIYAIALSSNALILGYLLVVAISLYTVIGILIRSNHSITTGAYDDTIPIKLIGWLLSIIGMIFLVRQAVEMIQYYLNDELVDPSLTGQWFSDCVIFAFPLIIGRILLLKGIHEGYSIRPGLILGTTIAFLGLVPFLIIQALISSNGIDWFGIVFVSIFGFPLMFLFLRFFPLNRSE